MADQKTCKCCGTDKPLESFWRHKRGKHGRLAVCIACEQEKRAVKPPRQVVLSLKGVMLKVCKVCGEDKFLDEFSLHMIGKY